LQNYAKISRASETLALVASLLPCRLELEILYDVSRQRFLDIKYSMNDVRFTYDLLKANFIIHFLHAKPIDMTLNRKYNKKKKEERKLI